LKDVALFDVAIIFGDSMRPNSTDLQNQERLKKLLQAEISATKFENLVAALLSRLLEVPIAVAKSGFQYGGDAGPAGQQERRFRIECKKYRDTTSLSDRELLGEMDQALARDEALEAWFLAATRNVPEQLVQDLILKGDKIGVPVVILDWKDKEIAVISALCAFNPNIVEKEFSKEAGELARILQPASGNAIDMLRRDLQSWSLGFETLRKQSHEMLDKIWNSPRESNAKFGQNAAGGAQSNKVKRIAVNEKLSEWWRGLSQDDASATVVGWDGVGKTWATLEWLVDNKEEQPIILIVPSSAAAALSGVSENSLKLFLADRLYEVSGVRDSQHWLRRINLLLKRPINEGPVITLFFDGINQEHSVPWLSIFKVLQGNSFSGRVRVIASTRNHHFEEKLSSLRGLIVPTVKVVVDVYDTAPGGELEQMLAFEGLTQDNLHSELIELARTPRLFKLVVRFRERLVEADQVTVHRLLWEYGRDSFGERAGKSFSENDWLDWLKEIAQKHRNGIHEFSLKSLGETAVRPDLSESEVFCRLSDIIDGQFAKPNPSGYLQLTPMFVAHALGAALIAHLDTLVNSTFESFESELTKWFDPIAGFDERSEILRAAVSILVERGNPETSALAGVLVTAWLQSQNMIDNHRKELIISLRILLMPYLMLSNTQLAVLTPPQENQLSSHCVLYQGRIRLLLIRLLIVQKIGSKLSLEMSIPVRDSEKLEKHRSDRYKRMIGIDSSGCITVLGVELELVDRNDGVLQAAVPSILDGFPLLKIHADIRDGCGCCSLEAPTPTISGMG
jgi:hypothetical protein